MSNSNLVSYTKISPNKSHPRNHGIDTISIHCMAGNLSVETCGNLFANKSRQASSNYGIGSDGRIALYVDEGDRSWCSNNAANDNRAITIEVANDGGAPDWHVSDKAIESLIKLCADICKRNNIKELKWKGDKSLIGKIDQQNMTVHRWFAAKACPGDYLYNKHGYIASEVNKLLGVSGNNSTSVPQTPTKPSTSVNVNVTYAVKTSSGWLPEVNNLNDYAGIENQKIIGFMAKVDKGSLKYQVHTVGGGWLPYVNGYDRNNSKNGWAGNGKPIDAIRLYYDTPADLVKSSGYKKVKYHVSPIGSSNYYGWQLDDEVNKSKSMDGYAGAFGRTIDKIQVVIE